jgi:diguanylate cyclase (GGDEF)-like protein/PAS domain S-box-containing protein
MMMPSLIKQTMAYSHVEDMADHFFQAIDSLADPVFIKNRAHRWVLLNQACCQLIGQHRDDLIGKSDFDFFPEHEAKAFWQKDEEIFNTGLESVSQESFTDCEGNKQAVVSRKVRYKDGFGQYFLMVVMTNVNKHHLLIEQLEAQQLALKTLITNTPDVIIRYGLDCRRSYISQNYEQVYGNPISEALGKKPTESWGKPYMDAAEYEQRLKEVMASGKPCDIELDWFTENGDYVCQSLRVVAEYDDNGELCSALTFTRDVSELKRAIHRAQASEQEFRTLVEHSPDIVIRYDTHHQMLFANPAYKAIKGLDYTQSKGNGWLAVNISSGDYRRLLQLVMDSGEVCNVMVEWKTPAGILVSHDLRIVPEYDVQGRLKGTLVIGRDISRLRRAEIELTQREQEFRVLVEHSPDTINRYDRDCRRIYVNPKMLIVSGMPLDALLYKTPEECPEGEQAVAYQNKIRQVFNSKEVAQFELNWTNHHGKTYCTHIHLTPEFGLDGEVVSVLAVGRDITAIDAYRQQINHLAFSDLLTNLPNRILFNDSVRQAVEFSAVNNAQFGLIVMDLDHFKEVNDALGHTIGDQVLCEAADRLQSCVRHADILARLGGDEFAILVPEIYSCLDLDVIVSKILIAFNLPFVVNGSELFITTSIGIAMYPDDSADVETLFRYVDSAMYYAKSQGRNNYQFYTKNLGEAAAERMSIESDLRKSLERNELELYYQPQVELATGKVVGAEALLRWNHYNKGMVTPDKFIHIAEETGMIVNIGEWVLHTACQAAVMWNTGRETPFCVAVNLSTRQFIRNDLVGGLQRILQKTGCAPSWIKLEITEGLLLEDSTEVATMLDMLHEMGHTISIDDFGTGYSALSYLNRFPVSQIKIDRSFVQDIPNSHEKTELVKVMISIAQVLKMELVAEGVETQEQADCLLVNGGVIGQGYLFGRPMPQAAFEALMVESEGE